MPGKSLRTIDYGPAAPVVGRRRLRRWAVLGATLLVAAAAPLWWPPAWRQAQLLHWQRQCARYSAPAGQVAYSEDPAKVARLGNAPDYIQPVRDSVGTVPEAWSRFYSIVSPPGLRSLGTVFLHRRQSPNGTERLIALDVVSTDIKVGAGPYGRGSFTWPHIHARSFRMAGPLGDPVEKRCWPSARSAIEFPFTDVTLYAGQPDPGDPSHFTIGYTGSTGESGIIDGWLRDDGLVALEMREPSTSRADD
jgi:hypothetical protein